MGLERVKEEVLQKAKEKADAILKTGRAEIQRLENQMQEQIQRERKQFMDDTAAFLDEMSRQEVSQAKLDCRNNILRAKKEFIDQCFARTRQKIEHLSADDKKNILTAMLKQGQKQLPVKYAYCNKNDVPLLRKLGNFTVMEAPLSSGLILENEQQSIRVDFSAESLLERIKEENLMKISSILFEQKVEKNKEKQEKSQKKEGKETKEAGRESKKSGKKIKRKK